MRLRDLVRESWAMIWFARVPSALIMVVVAAMCLTTLATVGSSAGAVASVTRRMEEAGARRLVVGDTGQQDFINERTLGMVRAVSGVESAHALGLPFDAVNGVLGAGGPSVPVWPVLGQTAGMTRLVRGRAPGPGEAIVSTTRMATLRLSEPAGYLVNPDTQQQYAIVGAFVPEPGFEDLAEGALTPAAPGASGQELRVLVDDITLAPVTVRAVMGILAPADPSKVRVESPTGLAQTARDLHAQLVRQGRTLLLMIVGAGGFFVAAVVFADVLVRRRALGRRRTLGISRSDLAALEVLRAGWTAALGATGGTLAGLWLTSRQGVDVPSVFALATAVLGALIAAAASLPPAAFAALRDPVAVMRTP